MDISFVLDRLAVGEGIWTADRMAYVAMLGLTHIIDVQQEFDDTELGQAAGLEVLWNPTDDDFRSKPASFFRTSVDYALAALADPAAAVYIHCAAGVHRAPLTAAAVLVALGYNLADAVDLVRARRPVADFPEVYLESLRQYVAQHLGRVEVGGEG